MPQNKLTYTTWLIKHWLFVDLEDLIDIDFESEYEEYLKGAQQ